MIDNEKYNKIQEHFLGVFAIKQLTYLILSVVDIAGALYFSIKDHNYYSLILFGLMLIYFVFQFFSYQNIIKKNNYIIVETICNGAERAQFGYSMTNSKIYNFEIKGINNKNAKAFYNDWNKERNIRSDDEFIPETQLQFTHTIRVSDIKASKRESNLKFHNGDQVFIAFMVNQKRSLNFTNTTMLSYQVFNSPYSKEKENDKYDEKNIEDKAEL